MKCFARTHACVCFNGLSIGGGGDAAAVVFSPRTATVCLRVFLFFFIYDLVEIGRVRFAGRTRTLYLRFDTCSTRFQEHAGTGPCSLGKRSAGRTRKLGRFPRGKNRTPGFSVETRPREYRTVLRTSPGNRDASHAFHKCVVLMVFVFRIVRRREPAVCTVRQKIPRR